MVVEQLTLFGESEIEWGTESDKSIFSEWSYSRRGTLEQCARKYYYQYYGSILRKSNNDPQKEKLHFLKKLQNRHLRTGEILHRIIKTYLKKLQDGKQLLFNWLQQMGLADFQKDIRFSQKYKHGNHYQMKSIHPRCCLNSTTVSRMLNPFVLRQR